MKPLFLAVSAVLLLAAPLARAGEPAVHLVLKDHRFSPSEISVPAGQRIRVELVNQDGASEEFDSDDLHVEKDVTPHGKVTFEIGPLKPGTYGFIGELHASTAAGTLTAVEAAAKP